MIPTQLSIEEALKAPNPVLRWRASRADSRHRKLVNNGGAIKIAFIRGGLLAYLFEKRGEFIWLGYESMEQYIADTDNHQNPSSIRLSVQVVRTLVVLMGFPIRDLNPIGEKKLKRLIPYFNRKLVPQYLEALDQHDSDRVENVRDIVADWLLMAAHVSDNDLAAEMGQRIAGYETRFSQSVKMARLREMVSDEALEFFGLNDLPDDEIVIGHFKYPTNTQVDRAVEQAVSK